MRLFGIPGGTLDEARATYGFTPPFDLPFSAAHGPSEVIPATWSSERPAGATWSSERPATGGWSP